MKESTKTLFLHPLLFQETITVVVILPLICFIFLKTLNVLNNHLSEELMCTSTAALVGSTMGFLAKYIFVRPAIEIMEKSSFKPEEVLLAVRSTSRQPLVEAIVSFLRWSLMAILICVMPYYYLWGFLTTAEALFMANLMVMAALSIMPFFYLASENSLVPFYQKCKLKGVLDSGTKVSSLSLNKKLFTVILLIAIPPIGNLLGVIYLSFFTGLKLDTIQFGFVLIIVQTIIMTFLNGYLLMKSLSASVGNMSFMFEDMAKGQGDLTKRLQVTGTDEVGMLAFWFNRFMDDLEKIIANVRGASLALHQSIEEVSTGSQDLSQSTQEQASSIEEISASIEEMNGTVQHNAELIREGKDTSQAVTKLIDNSKDIFSNLIKAMGEISKDSKKIGDIVVTVNEVAFQTNLLALNAAVEAARAGEHGKGFAVVAEEVRSLAQRSGSAAKEIRNLIEGTVGKIGTGDDMVKKTSQSLEEMVSHMELFFRMMEVINSSSTEQTGNIRELTNAIGQIDTTTQKNASTVEELASVLENLRNEATVLASNVRKFKVTDEA
jgi:methyl-accepting chemotaxis protein